MSKRPPTERQLQIAETMLRHFDLLGDWPTQRKIADALGIQSADMNPYLTALLKKGVTKKIPNRNQRNIGFSKKGEDPIRRGWQPSLPL